MKCLAIGDPHFIESNAFNILDYIKKILLIIKDNKPDFVVVLGDLLDSFEKVNTLALNLAIDFIKSIANKCAVYLIIGNHDYINNQQFLTENHPFKSLKGLYNINICDHVMVETFSTNKQDYKFVFCPYVPPGRFEEALNTCLTSEDDMVWSDATCIFAHQEFYGCSYNPTTPSTDGDVWPVEYPLVISGHIHTEGFLQDNIYYPGNSIQKNYHDSPSKTIALVDFNDNIEISKIKIVLKQKKMYSVNIENINDFKPEKNVQGILTINSTDHQQKVFRKSAKFKELSNPENNLIIVFSKPYIESKPLELLHELKMVDENQDNTLLFILEKMIENEDEWTIKAYQEFINSVPN